MSTDSPLLLLLRQAVIHVVERSSGLEGSALLHVLRLPQELILAAAGRSGKGTRGEEGSLVDVRLDDGVSRFY